MTFRFAQTLCSALVLLGSISGQARAATYRTNLLTNTAPESVALQVEWSTAKTTGLVTEADLTDLTVRLLSPAGVVLNQDVVVASNVLQAIGGRARTLADLNFRFQYGDGPGPSLGLLRELRNLSTATAAGARGITVQLQSVQGFPTDRLLNVTTRDGGSVTDNRTVLISTQATAQVTTYRTNLFSSANPLITGVQLEWAATKMSGTVTEQDLTELSFRVFTLAKVLVSEEVVITRGVVQPTGGRPRTLEDVRFRFQFGEGSGAGIPGTSLGTLHEIRNVLTSTMMATFGDTRQIEHDRDIPLDGLINVTLRNSGNFVSKDSILLAGQSTGQVVRFRTNLLTDAAPSSVGFQAEWASTVTTGAVTVADLTDLTVRQFSRTNTLLYEDVVLAGGTLKPIGGKARTPADVIFDFQFGDAPSADGTVTGAGSLRRIRNVLTTTLVGSTGETRQYQNNFTLPQDRQLVITTRNNGESPELSVVTYAGQATTSAGLAGANFTAAGVVNGASFQGGGVTPGEIITIFGNAFGPPTGIGAQLTADRRIATAAGGARVLFDSIAAPIVYAVAGQTSVVVPYAFAGRTSTVMEIEFEGRKSAPVSVPIVAAAPAIFTLSGGVGQAVVVNGAVCCNSVDRPATAGTAVVMFATGEGQTSPPGVDGRLTEFPRLEDFPKPVLPVRVFVGGREATVSYAGAAPGFLAGLMQINFTVPLGLARGVHDLVLRVGTIESRPGVTMAVQP
jgi:uncharacterized protein (TIGR03437 family)